MVHKYQKKGKKRIYTQAQKKELIAKYKSMKDKVSVRQFALQHGVPLQTFRDWLAAEEKVVGTGKTTGLSPKVEQLLVLLMVMLSASGLPLAMKQLPQLCREG